MRVLVLEDDDHLRLALEISLRDDGLAVDVVETLAAADEAVSVNSYDCAVFDRTVPDGDALDYVARRRRQGWTVPVLFLTALDAVGDRVDGLRWGDDYLVKPFAMEELLVRVRSLCRRVPATAAAPLRLLDIELDPARHEVYRGDTPLSLTPREFAVLRELLAAGGEVVSRRRLIAVAWDELVPPASNVLDVVIRQLRRKLGPPEVVRTVRGAGYYLGPARTG